MIVQLQAALDAAERQAARYHAAIERLWAAAAKLEQEKEELEKTVGELADQLEAEKASKTSQEPAPFD